MSDEFNAHEFVDSFFNSTSTPPTNEEEPLDAQTQVAGTEGSTEESVPAPPAIDYEAQIAKLQDELASAKKQYNDVQSDVDRRVNVATKKATAELNEKVDKILAALAGRSNSLTGTSGQMSEENDFPHQQAPVDLIRSEVNRALSSDERIKASKLISDFAEFRTANPDSQQYDFILQSAYEELPWLKDHGVDGMNATLRFAKNLIARSLSMAKAMSEAAKSQSQPAAAKQPVVPKQTVTASQAEALAQKAARFTNDQGVSASSEAKPKFDHLSQPSLRQGVENLLATFQLPNRSR